MTPASTDETIFQTLLYADIFDYPLTLAEIHHYLIGASYQPEVVGAALEASPWLHARVTRVNGYFAVRERETIGALREARQKSSALLWQQARHWAGLTGSLPFVRMVAITGALAVNNAPDGDDIDLLIVTAPGRVWLARALAVGLVRIARLFGVGLCPNYVLSETALVLEPRNLFVAHDLAQMVPLVGHAVYAEMRAANRWSDAYLPHAQRPLRAEADLAPRGLLRALQRWAERLLSGRTGDALEGWERRRKLRKFSGAAQSSEAAAQLDADRVKGHFNDHGRWIIKSFEDRLASFLGPAEAAD